MSDSRYPYHAISHYDSLGNPPFFDRLPAEEEDFASLQDAREWLAERGGGRIERYAERGTWLYSRETVPPRAPEGAVAAVSS